MTEVDWLIVADDLTGACDAAVQFARDRNRDRQGAVTVMLAPDTPPPGASVIAVSTDSRNLEEREAAAAVAAVAQHYRARSVFKKIDSVLRGHPGAEIAAAMEAFGYDDAVATPAFPALGRFVNASNAAEVERRLRMSAPYVETDADLDRLVASAAGRRVLWAGSGGLAAALARQSGSPRSDAAAPCRARVTFCIGSDHPVTLAQLDQLRAALPESEIIPAWTPCIPQALLLSGGDTAAAACRAAGVRRIDLCGEVQPGIPWGFLRCGPLDGVPVVTKSGGFGAPDALIRVAEFFQ